MARLYAEFLLDERVSHPVSKGNHRHPAEETHFRRLYPLSHSFCHYLKLETIDEGRNVDQLVNRELHLSVQLSSPQHTDTY